MRRGYPAGGKDLREAGPIPKEAGVRNVKTNPEYKARYMRARNEAIKRLIAEHPATYERLLREERAKVGLGYKRVPRPRGVDPSLLPNVREARWVLCRGCMWKARRFTYLHKACPRCGGPVTLLRTTSWARTRPANNKQALGTRARRKDARVKRQRST